MTPSSLNKTTFAPAESAADTDLIDDSTVEAFRSEAALLQLPQTIQEINRVYLRNVNSRSLLTATEAVAWLDHEVTVFLRHDKVKVFAVVHDDRVAMADFLTLIDIRFHVSKIGRTQSNADQGPLPNFRTVHAFLTGRLCRIADSGIMPDDNRWEAVRYNPAAADYFFVRDTQQPITCASAAQLVPGSDKVWCPSPTSETQDGESAEADKDAAL